MNRKEGIIVGALLLTTFVGSTFAAPAVQQMLILNDPLNVRVVETRSLHTTSVDIEILNAIPGATYHTDTNGVFIVLNAPSNRIDFAAAFSFAPQEEFVQVTTVSVTILVRGENTNDGDMFSVSLNGQSSSAGQLSRINHPINVASSLQNPNVRVGSNMVTVGVTNNTPGGYTSSYFLYHVRLTVEYTFMA